MLFREQLKVGLLGEGVIARWLIGRGWNVLPAYEIEIGHGKGPRLFTASGQIISPDLLVFRASEIYWCEAKTKSAFTWHRMSETWQTGIDRRHWLDYLRVADETSFPVWLLFLHKPGNTAKDTPAGLVCPCGLFGNRIEKLKNSIHHEHDGHGPSGMVYWTEASLKKLTTFEKICPAN